MKDEEVNRCQIQEWWHRFRLVTFRTMIQELPESFIDYLVQGEQVEGEQLFPELEKRVEKLIRTLNGQVYVKLNWSSPKDSSLIKTNENGMCTSFKEIVLLLKSSKSVARDLSHAYDLCSAKTSSRPPKFFLAIRQSYPPSEMEFRCFVRDHHIVAISQRNITKFYPSLDGMKSRIEDRIQNFFTGEVKENFESVNYTFDVYLNNELCVKLVDFSPWGKVTQPLLFAWEYLENVPRRSNGAEFRTLGHRESLLLNSIPSAIKSRDAREDEHVSGRIDEDVPVLPVQPIPSASHRRNVGEDAPVLPGHPILSALLRRYAGENDPLLPVHPIPRGALAILRNQNLSPVQRLLEALSSMN